MPPTKGKRNKSINLTQKTQDPDNTLQSVPSDYSRKRLSLGESKQLDLIGTKKSNSIDQSGKRVKIIRNSEDLKEFLQDEYNKK